MARSQEYAFPSQYPDTVTHYSQRFWNAKSAMTGYRQQMSTPVKYTASLQQVLATKSLQEFQSHYFELAGYSSFEAYNQATNPIFVFENVKIPLMILKVLYQK
mgnify:CR=1 FL=1